MDVSSPGIYNRLQSETEIKIEPVQKIRASAFKGRKERKIERKEDIHYFTAVQAVGTDVIRAEF